MHAVEAGVNRHPPARVVLMGVSQGGAMACAMAARPEFSKIAGVLCIGGWLPRNRCGECRPRASSPRPRALFLHGNADTTVPVKHATAAQREWSSDCGLRLYEGVAHDASAGPCEPLKRDALTWLRRRFTLEVDSDGVFDHRPMLGSSVVKVLRDSNNKSSCTHLRGVVSDGLANDVLKELEGIELDNRTTAEMKASYPTQRCFSHDVYGEKRRSLSPRHVLALSLVGDGRAYPYAGQKRDAFDCKGLPAIVALMRLLSALFGVPLDFALVNRYDLAQGHHLNAHSDAEEDLVPGAPIVAVTLGVALPFEVTYGVKEQSVTDPSRKGYKIVQNGQPPAESERRTVTFLPKHGDVVIMHGALQQHYQHSIPKPPLGQQGIRYSITARALVRG